jgi:hypothetical protein
MKKNVRIFLYQRNKNILWKDDTEEGPINVLDKWPDLKLCIKLHYQTDSEMKQYHHIVREPAKFGFGEGFMKSVNRYCTTTSLKLKLIDSMTKIIYRIPSSGLRDASIKERPGLWHFYISASWRVFYRKSDDYMLFEEFCPHKKAHYYRRS